MRIVRVKLKADVSTYLKTLCVRYRLNDLGFVQDLYSLALTKGGGLPDDARLDKLIAAYAKLNNMQVLTVKVILRKRRQLLKEMASNPIFQNLIKVKKTHPRAITEQLLEWYFEMFRRTRQSQCMTCQFLSSCEFGKSYGASVTNIHVVVDPDYNQKAHPECPERPIMEPYEQIMQAQAQTNAMAANPAQLALAKNDPAALEVAEKLPVAAAEAEQAQAKAQQDSDTLSLPKSIAEDWEDEDNACGLENNGAPAPGGNPLLYSTSFARPSVNLDMNVVNRIRMSNLIIFEMARKLSSKLAKAHKGKFKPSAEVTKNQTSTTIQSIGDVTRVLPREHAKSDDEFNRKLTNRQLVKRESHKQEQKRHLLYILIDTSDSMTSCVSTNTPLWKVVSRALLAASFSLALVDLIESEEGIVFIRGFDGSQGPLRSARVKDEFQTLRRFLTNCAFNGCSTDIPSALNCAIGDITAAKDELRDAEILLITDCGSQMPPASIANFVSQQGKTALNVLDVSSSSSGTELAAGQKLREMADHYYKAAGGAKTLDNLVSLVGGKKK